MDYENGRKINETKEVPKDQNPITKAIENSPGSFGDIDASPEEIQILESGSIEAILELRSVMMEKRWPRDDDGMVRIPYFISGVYNDKEEAHIARAFEDFENNTCIRYYFNSKHFPLQLRMKLSYYCKNSYLRCYSKF